MATYEMGRQPFGLASPAAWLRRAGIAVEVFDLSRQPLNETQVMEAVRGADLIAIHLPMHTATRLAMQLAPRLKELNGSAHLAAYGLYAPLNARFLRAHGFASVLGGEFEEELCRLAVALRDGRVEGEREAAEAGQSVPRLAFVPPERVGLPPLSRYAQLEQEGRAAKLVGYTEASRGCKHHCRHCPIVPVYQGQFRVVAPEVVLADIAQQVEAGAQHITFGDPDFLNGPTHALRVVRGLHARFPEVTYDATIKVEHLLQHAELLPELQATGCALITSAVESFDDTVLERLQKRHTRADVERAVELVRRHGIALNPTLVAFTPWTSLESYQRMLDALQRLELEAQVAPIQLAVRLLLPEGSGLLELGREEGWLGEFNARQLSYEWRHTDSRVDELCLRVQELVQTATAPGTAVANSVAATRERIFAAVRNLTRAVESVAETPAEAEEDQQAAPLAAAAGVVLPARATIPYLNEPWFC